MNYTIPTRARRQGLFFERHELESLGISENAKCWGVWVEGRYFDRFTRFSAAEGNFTQESPQLAVSPIHPMFWPTAFRLEVYLSRRPDVNLKQPERVDSFLGLTDALRRCGVNILSVRTAQVAYDLVSFQAICELPRLRAAAAFLVSEADRAGQEMETLRLELTDRESDERLEALRVKEIDVYQRRVAAFQALGLLMVPRLAELESRLLAMDAFRFAASSGRPDALEILVKSSTPSPSAPPGVEGKFAAVVGWPPNRAESESAWRVQVEGAASTSWFLSRKVATAGENTYFLSYASIMDRKAVERHWPRTVPRPTAPLVDEELSAQIARGVYLHAFQALRTRVLPDSIHEVVPESPARDLAGSTVTPRSGVAERMLRYSDDVEYEHEANVDFFRRQALDPIRISSLPSLAHSRLWAFAGAEGRGRPIALRYAANLLRLDSQGPDSSSSLLGMFHFLNSTTGASPSSTFGEFRSNIPVLANVNLRDKFMRLRFLREEAEFALYLTLRIGYKIVAHGTSASVSSEGLLHAAALLLGRRGFRMERVSNTLLEIGRDVEIGTLEIVGRVSAEAGVKFCELIRTPAPTPSEPGDAPASHSATEASRFQKSLLDRLGDPEAEVYDLSVSFMNGFVDWDR